MSAIKSTPLNANNCSQTLNCLPTKHEYTSILPGTSVCKHMHECNRILFRLYIHVQRKHARFIPGCLCQRKTEENFFFFFLKINVADDAGPGELAVADLDSSFIFTIFFFLSSFFLIFYVCYTLVVRTGEPHIHLCYFKPLLYILSLSTE